MLYPAPELPDNTPIDNVRFSTRIQNALIAAGWLTVAEIREASDATLLGLQDLRKGSVAQLRGRWVFHRKMGCDQPGQRQRGNKQADRPSFEIAGNGAEKSLLRTPLR